MWRQSGATASCIDRKHHKYARSIVIIIIIEPYLPNIRWQLRFDGYRRDMVLVSDMRFRNGWRELLQINSRNVLCSIELGGRGRKEREIFCKEGKWATWLRIIRVIIILCYRCACVCVCLHGICLGMQIWFFALFCDAWKTFQGNILKILWFPKHQKHI